MSDTAKLEKIGVIEVLGEQVHVVKNGTFGLVEFAGRDVYDTPYYRRFDLAERGCGEVSSDIINDLVRVIGELLVRQAAREDSRRASLEERP